MVIFEYHKHTWYKTSEKQAQNNENQNFAYEAMGISCMPP